MDRGEEVGGVAQVGERQLEEELLGGERAAGAGALGDLLVVGVALEIALSKIVGLEVSPVTESSSM